MIEINVEKLNPSELQVLVDRLSWQANAGDSQAKKAYNALLKYLENK